MTISTGLEAIKNLLKNIYYKDIILLAWIGHDGIISVYETNAVSYFVTREKIRSGISKDEEFVANCIKSIINDAKKDCKKFMNEFEFCRFHESIQFDERLKEDLLYTAINYFYVEECQKFFEVGADHNLVVNYLMRDCDKKDLSEAKANLFTHGTRDQYYQIFFDLYGKLIGIPQIVSVS